MFKNLKTSKQISLKFTLFSAVLLIVVACIVNIFFFYSWYLELKGPTFMLPFINDDVNVWDQKEINNEWSDINFFNIFRDGKENRRKSWEQFITWDNFKLPRLKDSENRFSPERDFPRHELRLLSSSQEAQAILEHDSTLNIMVIDGYYLHVNQVGDQLVVRNVSPQISLQMSLFWISLLVCAVWIILSYFISLWFVKSSLKKLNSLNSALEKLDIDNLKQDIEIEWAEDDEINKVIMKFNEAIKKIENQTVWLKDFVRNASHELRTPLMWVSTLIDLARKSKDYEWTLQEVKWEIKRMDWLLEALLLITKVEERVELPKEKIDLIPSLKSTITELKKEFELKEIEVKLDIPEKIEINVNQQWWESIMRNLLRNAFKYCDNGWTLHIELNKEHFKVQNSWEGIPQENIDKIWERFWQADSSHWDTKSFWLWLYLSKLFAEKQKFGLSCDSKIGEGATFTLSF